MRESDVIMDIPIRRQNKHATLANKQQGAIVCGNSDYELVFEFDEEWAAHEWKRVCCVSDGYHGRIVEAQVGTTNRCSLPLVHGATYIDIGVYMADVYYAANRLTTEQYDELIQLICPVDTTIE